MPAQEGIHRPRALTVIGWLLLVLAALAFCRSLINLIIWKVIQPAAPGLLEAMSPPSTRPPFFQFLLDHLTAWISLDLIAALAVGVMACGLLRLWPWTRIALQGVGAVGLLSVILFETLWVILWVQRQGGRAGASWSSRSRENLVLLAVVVVCLAIEVGLVRMIIVLRSTSTRGAFERAAGVDSRA